MPDTAARPAMKGRARELDEEVRPSRLADGFDQIASDLLRALGQAKFTATERWLVDRAMEASWFMPRRQAGRLVEPEPFHLGMSKMAKLSGFNRTHLIKAHAGLVECRVFLPSEDFPEFWTFNKDFTDWLGKDGRPRLSGSEVEWCLEVKNKPRGVGKNRQDDKVGVGSSRQTGKVTVGKTRHQLSAGVRRSVGSARHFEASPLGTPIEEHAPGELRELESKTPQPPEAGGQEGEESASLPQRKTPNVASEAETAVRRLVLAVPGHERDDMLADQVTSQFRQRVAEGYLPTDVHASFLSARADRPKDPARWCQWVATNLGRRKVRNEVAVEAIKTDAESTDKAAGPGKTAERRVNVIPSDPEERATLQAAYRKDRVR